MLFLLCLRTETSPLPTLFGLRGLENRDGLRRGFPISVSKPTPDVCTAVCCRTWFAPASSPAKGVETDSSESDPAFGRFRRLFFGRGICSSTASEEAFLFRNERDPSMGSSSRMRLLKTECDPGRAAPRCAGSKSLASFGADARLWDMRSSGSGWSGSRAFSTQFGHRHCSASS